MENVIRVEDGKYVGGAAIPIKDFVEVVTDGIKTMGTCLDELYALIDHSKINTKSVLYMDIGTANALSHLSDINDAASSPKYKFERMQYATSDMVCVGFTVSASGSIYDLRSLSTYVDNSSYVGAAGWKLGIVY